MTCEHHRIVFDRLADRPELKRQPKVLARMRRAISRQCSTCTTQPSKETQP